MIDMRETIVPKSDQMNADDLIGGPRTIRITKVSRTSAPDQPISINYEGDGGKVYRPCKSMRRVMVRLWGDDGAAYIGKSLTLYCDERVTFGAAAVGGIRISHASHISEPVTMALTEKKASRKPFTVRPLAVEAARPAASGDIADALPRALAYLEKLEPSPENAAAARKRVDALLAKLREGDQADAVANIEAHLARLGGSQ